MREFRDIGAFILHLQALPAKMTHAGTLGLHDAAEMIAVEAKGMLGHRQSAAGPFAAWPELSAKTQEQRVELGFPENEPLLRTGELSDAIEFTTAATQAAIGVESRMVGDGTPQNPVRDIGEVAIDLELGTSRIPPRSFLGIAAVHCETRAVNLMAGAAADAMADLPVMHHNVERMASDIPF